MNKNTQHSNNIQNIMKFEKIRIVLFAISIGISTYSGRYPFTHSGDIRSLGRRFDSAKLILFS